MGKIKHIADDIIEYIKNNYDLDETILFSVDCKNIKVDKLIKIMKEYEEVANIEKINNQIKIEFYQ
ncbi:hypothetical protein QTH25_13530 [Clostridium perfringens]|uniref:hypothetical protein n=1 Tax=Clostridium perfringens TaxID=1502 RepID=UPI00338FBD7B|nr:hypothetical protein [Clostridium perfringens]